MFAVDVTNKVIVLNAPVVMLIVGLIIPAIAGKATKVTSRWTGPILLVLSAISAGLMALIVEDGSAVFTLNTLLNVVVQAVVARTAYKTLLAPFGITNNPEASPKGDAKLDPNSGIA